MIFTLTLNIALLLGLTYLLYNNTYPRLKPGLFIMALLTRLIAGCVLGFLYFYYYEVGDTIQYHKAASLLAETARNDLSMFWQQLGNPLPGYEHQPRAWNMVQLLSVIHTVTGSNYWLSSFWLSFYSFSGFYFLFTRIVKNYKHSEWAAFIGLMVFPSIVLWSSGIVKESIAMGSLAFATGLAIDFLFADRKKTKLLSISLLMVIVWILKYYVAAIYLIILIPVSLYSIFRSKKWVWLSVTTAFMLLIILPYLHPNFEPIRLLEVLYDNYMIFHDISGADKAVHYPIEEEGYSFVIFNAPFALVTALFLPLVDFRSLTSSVASIENIFILIMAFGWLLAKIKNKRRLTPTELVVLTYAVILAIFLGLSTPNLGTLSRYRVSFLPFLIWIFLMDNRILTFPKKYSISLWTKSR